MKKIILEKQKHGWSAMFFGIEKMPEDVEIPLTYSSSAYLHTVANNMRKRFPGSIVFYRDKFGYSTRVASNFTDNHD